ncbi:toxin-antitoxin system, toxin component, MazF family protein [Levilactobacillus cerevisiae]|uniref:toxin-antitoxin system, toxin component, MazF family protein n=1 Tax=Levilactobacillus cerevisiae TaxID=1704076 RepID=UPI000F77BD24
MSIYVSYVDGSGGKRRPVLIVARDSDCIKFFRLTSKYQSKSRKIQQQYFPLQDWAMIGLKMATYVDIGKLLEINFQKLEKVTYIGQLSLRDKLNLQHFIDKFSLPK